MLQSSGRKFMFAFVAVPFFLAVLVFHHHALAAEQAVITVDEAKEVLKTLDPNIAVLSVERAPVEGLWEIVVESGGRKGILYLTTSKDKVVSGSIVDVSTKVNLTKNRFDEINRIDISMIPLDDALVMGDPSAAHKVIVFDDPD